MKEEVGIFVADLERVGDVAVVAVKAASGGDLTDMRDRARGFLDLAADFAARTGTPS